MKKTIKSSSGVVDRDIDLTVGGRIRHARESARLTQQEISSELKISKRQYIRYEQGQAPIRLSTAEMIAEATGVTVEWIASGVRPMRSKSPGDKSTSFVVRVTNGDAEILKD